MALKVGINGFGRIGRLILRSIIENNRKDLEVVAINNKSNSEVSSFLLANDTVHGKLKSKITHSENMINVNGKKINSQTLKLPSGKILKGNERKIFETKKIKLDVLKSEKILGIN